MSNNLPVFVLDSFAVLAFLENENGAAHVQNILKIAHNGDAQVYLSIINVGEILYITERERGLPLAQKTLATLEQLPIEILPVIRERIFAAAHIKANYPVAYADAFAIAAAQEFSATVITGNPEFRTVETLIAVEWI